MVRIVAFKVSKQCEVFERGERMAAWHQPLHRTILAVDIEGFGRPERSNPVRVRLRGQLHDIVNDALQRAGVEADAYTLSDLGDGILALVSPAISKVILIDPLLAELDAGLRDHNRASSAAARLRLRIVLHAGEISKDPRGWSGQSLNFAFRLLDAEQLRAALRQSTAHLALIVSEPIYREVVEHEWRGIRKRHYHRTVVQVKETQAPAWIYSPGWDRPGPDPPAGEPDDPAGGVTNVIHSAGTVITGNVEVERDFRIGGTTTDDSR
jgi:hypothetical protein